MGSSNFRSQNQKHHTSRLKAFGTTVDHQFHDSMKLWIFSGKLTFCIILHWKKNNGFHMFSYRSIACYLGPCSKASGTLGPWWSLWFVWWVGGWPKCWRCTHFWLRTQTTQNIIWEEMSISTNYTKQLTSKHIQDIMVLLKFQSYIISAKQSLSLSHINRMLYCLDAHFFAGAMHCNGTFCTGYMITLTSSRPSADFSKKPEMARCGMVQHHEFECMLLQLKQAQHTPGIFWHSFSPCCGTGWSFKHPSPQKSWSNTALWLWLTPWLWNPAGSCLELIQPLLVDRIVAVAILENPPGS